jgi:hypothetical protein
MSILRVKGEKVWWRRKDVFKLCESFCSGADQGRSYGGGVREVAAGDAGARGL